MKARLAWSCLAILLCVSLASADLVLQRRFEPKEQVGPLSVRSYVDTFVGQKRAVVVASGNWRTCLGVYVFDAHGNCVTWDDAGPPPVADELAADWIPPETARYDVEIRNAGYDVNVYKISMR